MVDAFADAHLLHLVLLSLQVFGHLLQPESHRVVNDLDWTSFDDSSTDGRVAIVFTSIDQALIIKANCACVDETCLDQSLAKFTCTFEFVLVFLISRSRITTTEKP